jgi:hypothetical protein
LTTLPKYHALIALVRALDAPATTAELRHAAGLDGERDSLVAALWALEVAGEVHATRVERNGLIWSRGLRPDERPPKLERNIAPFEHLIRTLREHGNTPLSTALLMHITGLTRERVLGALKVSAALGLVAYRSDPIPDQRNWVVAWWWASATRGWDFDDPTARVSLDQTISEGQTVGDLVAAGRIPRRTRRGTLRFDAANSSDG